MGQIKQGILGGFNGTVGTVIGGSWKGLAYMRGKAQSIRNPRTEKQMTQRLKFGVAQKFLKVMGAYLQVGFRNYTQHQTANNAAMSYTVMNCVTGTYPSLSIDPSKVLISSGSLMPGRYCAAKIADNVATFTWEDNSGESHASVDDFAMPMVYNFTKQESVFTTEEASRVDCQTTLKLPEDWKNDSLSCYIAFASVTSNAVSPSVYIGDVKQDGTVAPAAGTITPSGSGSGSSTTTPGSTGDSGNSSVQ